MNVKKDNIDNIIAACVITYKEFMSFLEVFEIKFH